MVVARLQKPTSLSVERLGGELVEIVDVDAVLEFGDRGGHRARADLHQIGAAGQHRLGAHPDDMRGELVGDFGPRCGHARARRRARCRFRRRASASPRRPLPASSTSRSAARMRVTTLRRPEAATTISSPRWSRPLGDRAGEAAEVEMRPVDPLHRQAERRVRGGRPRPRCVRDGRADAARRTRACVSLCEETLSPKRAEIGIGDQRAEAERSGELAIVGDDVAKDRFVVVDEVDLVDRQHDVTDAEQRDDDRVAMGLRQQALARVDQQDREIGVRGAGRHVAGVLLVAGRVGDDERARAAWRNSDRRRRW